MLAERARYFSQPPLAVCSTAQLNPALSAVCAQAAAQHSKGGRRLTVHDIPLTASLLRHTMETKCGVQFGLSTRVAADGKEGFASSLLASANPAPEAASAASAPASATSAAASTPASSGAADVLPALRATTTALHEMLDFVRGAAATPSTLQQCTQWQAVLDDALKVVRAHSKDS
jgi:hypothetical protein